MKNLQNMITKMSDSVLTFVGTLQKVSKMPFASVYMDSGSRSLYLFVRVNSLCDTNPVYVATDTTADSLVKYLNRRIVLRTLFAKKHREYAEVVNGRVHRVEYKDDHATDTRLKKAGRFEPELCNNRVELEQFFSNYNQ